MTPVQDARASRPIRRRHSALRAIAALMLREMSTRFGRTPGGYIWVLLQPLGMIILLSMAFALMGASPALGSSFLLFKATGFLILSQFRTISQLCGMALPFSRGLLDYPGVIWIDALLARFLLNGLVTLCVTVIILLGIVLFEGLNPVLSWPEILAAQALSLMFAFGVGCLNGVLFLRFEVWQQAWAIITAPLFLISGVIVLYEDMPGVAREYLWFNPLLHITGLMRVGFYSNYNPGYISLPYVLACSLVPMVLGLLVLRRFHRVLLER